MTTREPVPEDPAPGLNGGSAAPASGTSGFKRYFLALFAVSLILYPVPFWLVRVPSFPEKWSRSFSLLPLEFGFTARGQNADVVIFGDSSAFFGIDASQMSAALGTKVLLLPGMLSELSVVGDLPLERYMKADSPPKLLVFYFTPWDFDYESDFDGHPVYEGVEMLLRHGQAGAIRNFVVEHPLPVMLFPLMFYDANLVHPARSGDVLRNEAETLLRTNGHVDLRETVHEPATCVIPQAFISKIRFDTVRRLSDKYRSSGTTIMAFAAPLPACLNAQAVIDRASGVIPAAPPRTMSVSLFSSDGYYAHLFPAGVREATGSLIQAVRAVLANRKP